MSVKAKETAIVLLRKHNVLAPPVDVELLSKLEGARIDYHDLEDDVSGLLVRQEDSAVIIVNLKHHPNRRRFTIGHELGHFVLHRSTPTIFVDNLLVDFRNDLSSRTNDRREREANAFAAHLLMPEHFLRADLQARPVDVNDEDAVQQLAQKYQVSTQALTIQLVNLGFARGLF